MPALTAVSLQESARFRASFQRSSRVNSGIFMSPFFLIMAGLGATRRDISSKRGTQVVLPIILRVEQTLSPGLVGVLFEEPWGRGNGSSMWIFEILFFEPANHPSDPATVGIAIGFV